MENPSIVKDIRSFETKMGYAGNIEPDLVIPTSLAYLDENKKDSNIFKLNKNDKYNNYYLGDKAISKIKESNNYLLDNPMKNGVIDNWDLMEIYWNQTIYNYLKCDPIEHCFFLIESIENSPDIREKMTEIFFETFNAFGLYIGSQPIVSLFGASHEIDDHIYNISKEQEESMKSLTGIVVKSGESNKTYIVPVCDGFILDSKIKTFPIGGEKISRFISQMLKERGEKISNEDFKYSIKDLKKKCYVPYDLIQEFALFDKKEYINGKLQQSKKFEKFEGNGKIINKPFSIILGMKLFLKENHFFLLKYLKKTLKNLLMNL